MIGERGNTNEFFAGLTAYLRAWQVIRKGRLWHLLIFPGLIGLLYFPGVALLTFWRGRPVAAYVQEHWLPGFLKHNVGAWLVTAAMWMLALYVGYVLFRNVVMILYSPILSHISKKTEEQMRPGIPVTDPPGSMIRGALRGIGMSLTSLFLSIACFLFCCLLLLVPIVGEIAMVILLPLTQMFFAGHGFVDPTLERRAIGVGESFRTAWRHRKRIVGCGAGFVLLSLVPLLGWFLAPTLGVIAGTLVALDKLESSDASQSTAKEREGVSQSH